MKKQFKNLAIQQLDQKFTMLRTVEKSIAVPPKGWIHAVRTSLGMSLRQMGKRLHISQQSVKEIEEREASGALTLRSLQEAARALNMRVVYGLVPINESLDNIIEQQAKTVAVSIVMRTATTMELEDQQNSPERLKKAIEEKTGEIKETLPRYLWD